MMRAVGLVLVVLAGCQADRNGDEAGEAEEAAQVELCQTVCVKATCDPSVDFAPDLDQGCAERCTSTVRDASETSCTERYQTLLDCLVVLSCDDFYLWLESGLNAPCTAEEQALADHCPQIGVRG